MPTTQQINEGIAGGLDATNIVSAILNHQIGAAIGSGLETAALFDPEPISKAILTIAGFVAGLFHGANPLQVPAAKIEQIFELASNNMYALFKHNLLTKQDALQGIYVVTQAAIQMEAQANLGVAAQKAIANLQKVNNAESEALQALPDNQNVSMLLLSNAQQYYQPYAQGWYKESWDASKKITDQYLQVIINRQNASNQIVHQSSQSKSKNNTALVGSMIIIGTKLLGLW